jgi:hypothetical protein
MLDRRIAELDLLIAESSAPNAQGDKHCKLGILRARLSELRRFKVAEVCAPKFRTKRAAMQPT